MKTASARDGWNTTGSAAFVRRPWRWSNPRMGCGSWRGVVAESRRCRWSGLRSLRRQREASGGRDKERAQGERGTSKKRAEGESTTANTKPADQLGADAGFFFCAKHSAERLAGGQGSMTVVPPLWLHRAGKRDRITNMSVAELPMSSAQSSPRPADTSHSPHRIARRLSSRRSLSSWPCTIPKPRPFTW